LPGDTIRSTCFEAAVTDSRSIPPAFAQAFVFSTLRTLAVTTASPLHFVETYSNAS
jgi:hypothetical protein